MFAKKKYCKNVLSKCQGKMKQKKSRERKRKVFFLFKARHEHKAQTTTQLIKSNENHMISMVEALNCIFHIIIMCQVEFKVLYFMCCVVFHSLHYLHESKSLIKIILKTEAVFALTMMWEGNEKWKYFYDTLIVLN